MNVTTIGCYINPMTYAGQVSGVILAASGMLMLPLFTVFVTSVVKNHYQEQEKRNEEIKTAFERTRLHHDEKKLKSKSESKTDNTQ